MKVWPHSGWLHSKMFYLHKGCCLSWTVLIWPLIQASSKSWK